jgi:hypothetical protein
MCFVLNIHHESFLKLYAIIESTHVYFVLLSLQSPYRARAPTVSWDPADVITRKNVH